MLGMVPALELDAELVGRTEMELVGDWVEETGMEKARKLGKDRSETAELCRPLEEPPRCRQHRPR